jgi:redox-sensitive bicupin YhaK (pirin superfamily)
MGELLAGAPAQNDRNDYMAGFSDHPHRRFETVTYMIAGRGIIHSKMPKQENGVMEGFQLWLNLPAQRKMIPAWYRDIPEEQIPDYVTDEGVTVRVIS